MLVELFNKRCALESFFSCIVILKNPKRTLKNHTLFRGSKTKRSEQDYGICDLVTCQRKASIGSMRICSNDCTWKRAISQRKSV